MALFLRYGNQRPDWSLTAVACTSPKGSGGSVDACASIVGRRRDRRHSNPNRLLAAIGYFSRIAPRCLWRTLHGLRASGPLWYVPVPAGTPRPLAGLSAVDATWSPDGGEIAYVDGEDLYRARSDGSEIRKLVHLPGMDGGRDGLRMGRPSD